MFNIWTEYNLPFHYSLFCYWKDFWNCISLCLPPCSCKHTVRLSFAKLYLAKKTSFMSQKRQDFLKILVSSIFSVWKSSSMNLLWQWKNAVGDIICCNWTNGTSNTLAPYAMWAPCSRKARAWFTSDARNLWPNQRTSVTPTVLMLGWPTLTRPGGDGCNVHIAVLWNTVAIYCCTTQLLRCMNQRTIQKHNGGPTVLC